MISALLGIVQPYLFTFILRALEPGNETSIKSFPLYSTASSLPPSFYTMPDAIYHIAFSPTRINMATFSNLGEVSTEGRKLAYFYTVVSFIFALIKSQADLQHLYYARRASVRMQSEIIASIYEKALVRKDIAGVVASDAEKRGGLTDGDEQDEIVKNAGIGKVSRTPSKSRQRLTKNCRLSHSLLPTQADL